MSRHAQHKLRFFSADWVFRERGSKDARLVPVAIAVWAGSLVAHQAFAWLLCTSWAWIVSLGVVLLMAAGIARLFVIKWRWAGLVAVAAAGLFVGASAALLSDTVAWYDPAAVQARTAARTTQTTVDIHAPVVASNQRSYDCQADGVVRSIEDSRTGSYAQSSAHIRVYMSDNACSAVERGGQYIVTGLLMEAKFGSEPLWLQVSGEVVRIRSPSWLWRAVHAMQDAMLAQVAHLSDQAQVLVPGLTLGVLGQDYVSLRNESLDVSEVYASSLEDAFKTSGIMHLMAVSGGHFVIIAGLIQRLCRALLLPRVLTALLVALAQLALTALMFPGDSVTRALVMGLIAAAAYAKGRPAQSLSALCWTVIAVLLVMPSMSSSYGFALSAAAVFGIVTLTTPLKKGIRVLMPDVLAEMIAMTIAAQVFTLPIQILMNPSVPLMSVPANLIVAPVVSLATITGIAALLTAWLAPTFALVLLRITSMGTLVMERTAMWLGSGVWSSLPWSSGIQGALAMLALELALGVILICLHRWVFKRHKTHADLPGLACASGHRTRIAVWWEESLRLLRS